ncbi:hypothetical protein BG015_011973 [Linnemannia schmuckeri]|uniref:F-box domain-containing protein n=1 Tax=Linnemannia schmuckeri TaxID=64567 RepID=A0A9P5S6Z6_9FUNG|nr:hypothetical protein BG015_011973 [Linnemannia schmuckeri]
MQITKETPSSTNPLDLSEIRTVIATYLNSKDSLSCMRVSRAWFQDFAPYVWHTINFDEDDIAFKKVTPEILDKYGAFISEALNITHMEDLLAIQHHKVGALKSIHVRPTRSNLYRELISGLLLRCNGSIHTLDIRCDSPSPDTLKEQRKQPEHYVRVADIIAAGGVSPSADNRITPGRGGCLRTLTLGYVCFTREGFSTLLRCSPSLDELILFRVIVMGHTKSIPLYTGSNLRRLSASLIQIYALDEEDSNAPCLLLHFPLLKNWNIMQMYRPDHWTTDPVCEDFSSWCPDLKNITFGHDNPELISNLLINTFQKVESCTPLAENLTPSTALGLIAHQATLMSIAIQGEMEDTTWTQWFHTIPRLCSNLQVLSLKSLELDSKSLDAFQWGCKDLRELRVRFKDLGDPEEIDTCLMPLCDWRRFGGGVFIPHKDKVNIETRVCQFLFQFKKLRTVWLGTKDYYLSPLYD